MARAPPLGSDKRGCAVKVEIDLKDTCVKGLRRSAARVKLTLGEYVSEVLHQLLLFRVAGLSEESLQRLRALISVSGEHEIARRLGVSRSRVHRAARGNKIAGGLLVEALLGGLSPNSLPHKKNSSRPSSWEATPEPLRPISGAARAQLSAAIARAGIRAVAAAVKYSAGAIRRASRDNPVVRASSLEAALLALVIEDLPARKDRSAWLYAKALPC